jgi:AcrR family transcriptional regulator
LSAATARKTPRRTPQQARSKELVARILDAGARVFAEEGYAAGTTNRIASAAGVSIGSLYSYFPDKDAIVTELVRRHIEDGIREIGARFADADLTALPLEERTRRFVEATVAIHQDHPALHRVLFEEAPRSPEVLSDLRSFERDTVHTVELLLADDPDVHVPDVALAAYMTVVAIESITHRYVSSHPEGIDAEAMVDEMTTLVVGYLRAHGTLRAES